MAITRTLGDTLITLFHLLKRVIECRSVGLFEQSSMVNEILAGAIDRLKEPEFMEAVESNNWKEVLPMEYAPLPKTFSQVGPSSFNSELNSSHGHLSMPEHFSGSSKCSNRFRCI